MSLFATILSILCFIVKVLEKVGYSYTLFTHLQSGGGGFFVFLFALPIAVLREAILTLLPSLPYLMGNVPFVL